MIERSHPSRRKLVIAGLVGALLFASCGSEQNPRSGTSAPLAASAPATSSPRFEPTAGTVPTASGQVSTTAQSSTLPTATTPALDSDTTGSSGSPDTVVGTIVRFAGPNTTVDVTIVEDNATARSFLSRLPLTVEFEDFNGREKISYPPGGLDVVESGHDSENGDFIYYVPWGNVGFYYNAAGIQFDDDVVLIGRYDATPEELVGLEGGVSISIVGD
jgi:hypothetical protein